VYRVIFCGHREWEWACPIMDKLIAVRIKHPDLEVVHGAGRGADLIAEAAAEFLGIPTDPHPADWGRGRRGGPERNRKMAASGIEAVYAFKIGFDREMRSGGTEDMVSVALSSGVPCQVIDSVAPGQRFASIMHLAVDRTDEGIRTKCGLRRQHATMATSFQSDVSCPKCRAEMGAEP
jgi:hypothetical protein